MVACRFSVKRSIRAFCAPKQLRWVWKKKIGHVRLQRGELHDAYLAVVRWLKIERDRWLDTVYSHEKSKNGRVEHTKETRARLIVAQTRTSLRRSSVLYSVSRVVLLYSVYTLCIRGVHGLIIRLVCTYSNSGRHNEINEIFLISRKINESNAFVLRHTCFAGKTFFSGYFSIFRIVPK